MTADSTTAILLCAGSSARMGGEDKLWADLGGEPLIAHSLRTLASLDAIDVLVLVAPAQRHAMLRSLAGEVAAELRTAEGGARRQDSVASGIAAAPDAAWYLVHDGARPLLSTEVACRTLDAAQAHGAALPAVVVADTLKRVEDGGRILDTVDRIDLRAVQTPQAFAGDLLRSAHAGSNEDATDDAMLVERLGEPVYAVEGDALNLKVTTPADLALARALLATERGE
ncbi:MAG TPA: 2-C-methyl-D-erythritol 4-phosphate cytidylyltransferase [Dehalococcoidia bacterium]|nr:2-C-methyl-D-erythritol 4-phosphate cytidylyltransferase [Dehalococcoidia bacterium]